MSRNASVLPIARPLPANFSVSDAFGRLQHLDRVLWLDSATGYQTFNGPADSVGNYSFLTGDPIKRLDVSIDDCDPWPVMRQWCHDLPNEHNPQLPPFQGGVAGLIGYEAGSWLESVGIARHNDLPTPVVSIGLYDWVIAFDHEASTGWILSQGLGESDLQARIRRANQRADQVEALLLDDVPPCPATKRPTTLGGLPETSQQHPTDLDGVTSSFSSATYRANVSEIIRRIRVGDSFQVNLAQRLLRIADLDSAELYRQLRNANPAPYGAFYDGGDFQVLSSSPEGFLSVRDRIVQTRPIKGTIRRGRDSDEDDRLARELLASEKDRAENVMIVDLMRNDLSRACEDESVIVKKLCEIERYQYVQHLVSVVAGRLRDDADPIDLLQACFPGGSVTGAPKIEAMRTIAELEPNLRGPYCGSLGYVSCGGNADFNILIRTITAAHGYWQIPVGGGITAKSDPDAEETETWTKAKGMLRATDARLRARL